MIVDSPDDLESSSALVSVDSELSYFLLGESEPSLTTAGNDSVIVVLRAS